MRHALKLLLLTLCLFVVPGCGPDLPDTPAFRAILKSCTPDVTTEYNYTDDDGVRQYNFELEFRFQPAENKDCDKAIDDNRDTAKMDMQTFLRQKHPNKNISCSSEYIPHPKTTHGDAVGKALGVGDWWLARITCKQNPS